MWLSTENLGSILSTKKKREKGGGWEREGEGKHGERVKERRREGEKKKEE